jgi:hypothetical protein
MDFEPMIITPRDPDEEIGKGASALENSLETLIDSAALAVEQFETTMQFESESDAVPDTLGAMVTGLFKGAVDQLTGVLTVEASAFSSLYDELERARKASENASAGAWIRKLRQRKEWDSAQCLELGRYAAHLPHPGFVAQ